MKQSIQIEGMHCVSCEILIKNNLKNIPWVSVKKLSHRTGKLELEYKNASDLNKIENAISKSGFSIKDNSKTSQNKFHQTYPTQSKMEKILLNIILLLFVLILLIITRVFDFGGSIIPEMDELRFSSAFLIGIVASLSTCLAVTGGIIIGYSKYLDKSHGIACHAKVWLAFQAGRLGMFFLGGAILWLWGNMLGVNTSFTGILSFLVGFLILYIGLQILGIVPNITKLWVALPSSFGEKITALWHPKYAPIAWALTFFLPCGFTQTMQILALSSGSFWIGGLSMLIFALGTFPVLFGLGLWVSSISEKKSRIFSQFIAVVLIFFGSTTILNAKNLLVIPTLPKISETGISQNIEELEYEIIEMWHNGWSTEPESITLQAGKNYKVIITPDSNGLGCMSTQYIPKIRSEVSYVQAWVPIEYNFIAPFAGKYDIVCASMWMKQWTIIFK